MKLLRQQDIRPWRECNAPKVCPITGAALSNPAVDHDHDTGLVRGVVSSEGNALLGRIENSFKRLSKPCREIGLPQMLRNMADYLDPAAERFPLLHPVGFRQLWKRFSRMPKDMQVTELQKYFTDEEISHCASGKSRTELYKKALRQ